MLALVDLARDDVIGPARRRGGAQPDLEEVLGLIPIDLLGPDQRGRARLRDRGQKSLETSRGRRRIVVEQPQPAPAAPARSAAPGVPALAIGGPPPAPRRAARALRVRGARGPIGRGPGPARPGPAELGVQGQAAGDRVAEAPGVGGAHDANPHARIDPRGRDDLLDGRSVTQTVVTRGHVDHDHGLGLHGLPGNGSQGPAQVGRDARGDHDRERLGPGRTSSRGAGSRRAHTARRLSLRRSRSDRPPQMPNLSSLARAYSRHSSRTSQDAHTRLASRAQGALLPRERPLVNLVTAEEEQQGLVVGFVGARERTLAENVPHVGFPSGQGQVTTHELHGREQRESSRGGICHPIVTIGVIPPKSPCNGTITAPSEPGF